MYTIGELLAHFKHSTLTISNYGTLITDLAYDTRKIHNVDGSLFFALIGQRDGHQYLSDAYDKGVRNFVVSDSDLDISKFDNCNFIWVTNTLVALQSIARFHRSHFSYPIIGITGSNGKTIVKEWLYQLLSPEYNCFQSPKSYNSQLGVALSLWQLNSDFDIAIIEAGISLPGEMVHLAEMINPTIGILTSIGTAHREGFDSQDLKLSEKCRLFNNSECTIVPYTCFRGLNYINGKVLTWGDSPDSDIVLVNINRELKETVVNIDFKDISFELIIPFVDQASIENVLTCISVMLYLGYDSNVINARVSELKHLEMRLQLKRGKNNSSIIDDSYSNDLASLQIALDFLNQQNQFEQRNLILSDFVGEEWTTNFENKLVEILINANLSSIYLIGTRISNLSQKVKNTNVYVSTIDFLNDLSNINFQNSTILIKGARKYKLERITSSLVEQSHETVLEINLNAIEYNIQQYRSKIASNVMVMAMVKAFSYGSGSFEIANLLQFNKVDYLTVAFVDEGVALRKAGVLLPIMVLSPHESTFEDLVRYDLEPEIYSIRILNNFIDFLQNRGLLNYPIHIKLDTGMHRLGFLVDEINAMLDKILDSTEVTVKSVFSHLVGAGSPDFIDFTKYQIESFLNSVTIIEQRLGYSFIRHICNTSGIIHHPEAHFDMVRLGIGLYGFDMSPKGIQLHQVSKLKTTITQIKALHKNETIGYDRKGVLGRDSIIATVKIGYADGYDRRFGNGVGKMLINGEVVPTIGNICMDMCMLDITGVEAKEGDEVVVFPDLANASSTIGTIPYELLTGISNRVKRVYFYE